MISLEQRASAFDISWSHLNSVACSCGFNSKVRDIWRSFRLLLRCSLGALRSKVTGVALHPIALLHYTVKTCQNLSDTHDGFFMPRYWPSSTSPSHPSLSSLQNGLQLLGQHHVALDLQLATHEGLHSIQLALRHGHQVRICHSDGAILAASRIQAKGARNMLAKLTKLDSTLFNYIKMEVQVFYVTWRDVKSCQFSRCAVNNGDSSDSAEI